MLILFTHHLWWSRADEASRATHGLILQITNLLCKRPDMKVSSELCSVSMCLDLSETSLLLQVKELVYKLLFR